MVVDGLSLRTLLAFESGSMSTTRVAEERESNAVVMPNRDQGG